MGKINSKTIYTKCVGLRKFRQHDKDDHVVALVQA